MMVDIIAVGLAVAVILSLVDELQRDGKDTLGWACAIGFGVLLWGRIG